MTAIQQLILQCFVIEPEDTRAFARAQYNAYHRGWVANKPGYAAEKLKRQLDKNPEANREYQKKWSDRNKLQRKSAALEKRYGITLGDKEFMRERQGNRCAICKKPFEREPHVDHCHSTGRVRGLLCYPCNAGLGYFKDSLELFSSAMSYLQKDT